MKGKKKQAVVMHSVLLSHAQVFLCGKTASFPSVFWLRDLIEITDVHGSETAPIAIVGDVKNHICRSAAQEARSNRAFGVSLIFVHTY